MGNDVLLSILNQTDWLENKYKKKSVLQLKNIMEYCETKFKNNNGNWSVKEVVNYCNNNNIKVIDIHFNLCYFYIEYAKRKKKKKTFKRFLDRLWIHINSKGIMKQKKIKLELIHYSELKNLLEDLKLIKNKYLLGTDDMLLELISENIKTPYTKETLRKYYYQSN